MELSELKKQFVPNPDDVILIKTLFLHPGWKKYEEKIHECINILNYNINQLINGVIPVTEQNLPILNQNINERRMFELMLLFKEDLLDEVDPNREEQIQSDGFSTKPE